MKVMNLDRLGGDGGGMLRRAASSYILNAARRAMMIARRMNPHVHENVKMTQLQS